MDLDTIIDTDFWLRITDDSSVPEMRIWILLIKSYLEWCIHLSRIPFLYFVNKGLLLVSRIYLCHISA